MNRLLPYRKMRWKAEEEEPMACTFEESLVNAGCDTTLAARLTRLREAGDTEGCVHLLRCHRSGLVEAMHEAQRPIDVCDWIIYTLQNGTPVA